MNSSNYFNPRYSLVLIALLALAACSHPKKSATDSNIKYAYETSIFTSYLSKQFDKSLTDSLTFYCKVPSDGCFGCMKEMYLFFGGSTFAENNCYAIMSATPTAEAMNLKQSDRILIDQDKNLDKLNICPYAPAVIITYHKTIINIIPINPSDDAESIVKQKVNSKGL